MNRPPSNAHDELLAALLVAYDEALGRDVPPEAEEPVIDDGEFSARFEAAKKCLDLLDRVSRFDSENPSLPADAETDPAAGGAPSNLARHCPRAVGRFLIERELGRGGLGVVYLARDSELGRYVAVKVPRSEIVAEESQQRFVREAEAAARLSHPHLVVLYEVGHVETVCYLVSEYCSGPTLARWLHDRAVPLPAREAATLAQQLAGAVHHAHSRGVLHRDIKPSNVMLELVGEGEGQRDSAKTPRLFPKLTDFGMAKLMESTGDQTRSGAILGTPAYMAPEQVEGRLHDIDARTDIYGLGAVLYELLTGAAPFRGTSDVDTLRQLLLAEPAPPRQLCPSVPRDLEAIALKCLAKKRDTRYPTAQHLAEDLGRFLQGLPTEARPLTAWGVARKWARRRPAAVAVAAVLIASVLTLLGVVVGYNVRLRDQIAQATTARQEAEQESEARRRLLYAADVRAAYESWRANNIVEADNLLARQIPAKHETDLREFAWHLLRAQCNPPTLSLVGHAGDVLAVAYSPDGGLLATAGKDGMAALWEAADGQLVHVLRGHSSEVTSVAFSPDGRLLATGSEDHTIRLWKVATGETVESLVGHADHVMTVAFSPDGSQVVSGSRDQSVRIWDAESGQPLHTLTGDMDVVRRVVFVPGRGLLCAGDEMRRIHLWRTSDWERLPGVYVEGERFFALAAASDGRQLLAAGRREKLSHWQIEDERLVLLRDLSGGHSERIRALAWAPDNGAFASAGADAVICLWRTAATAPHRSLLGHRGNVWSLAWSPDGQHLASAGADGVRIWPMAADDLAQPYPKISLGQCIRSAVFTSDGSRLMTGCVDGHVRVWSSHRYVQRDERRMHVEQPVPRVRVSDDDVYLAARSGDGTTNVWKTKKLVHLSELTASGSSNALAWVPGTHQLATTLDDNTLVFVDIDSGKTVRRVPLAGRPRDLAFATDGLLVITGEESLQIWDARLSRIVHSIPGSHWDLAVDRQSGLVAAEAGSTVKLIRLESGFPQSTIVTACGEIRCLALCGGTLAVAEQQPAGVSLWDTRTGQLLMRLSADLAQIHSLAFSPDGRQLVATGTDTTEHARIWEWSAAAE
jgi:WD40 repeat protein